MNRYQDRALRIDDEGITITSYLWPGHHRTIPFSSIVAVEEIRLGAFSGRLDSAGQGRPAMTSMMPIVIASSALWRRPSWLAPRSSLSSWPVAAERAARYRERC